MFYGTADSSQAQISPFLLSVLEKEFRRGTKRDYITLLYSLKQFWFESQWKTELEEILEVAFVDGDPWVSMVAEVLKTYPSTGALNTEVGAATDEDNRRIFNDLANELRKLGILWSDGNSQKRKYVVSVC